jgi:2-C-methyl-D-erythritol 4-phosphate cytidylyltransferase
MTQAADRIAPPRLHALVPCAGVGERAGRQGPKQYAVVGAQCVVGHTLAALAGVARLDTTLIVLHPEDDAFERHVPGYRGAIARVGGATRSATVANGLVELRRLGAGTRDWVLVHDAARCMVQPAWIDRLIDACAGGAAVGSRGDPVGGLLALPLADTLKAEGSGLLGGRAASTLPRDARWQAQTPQMFRIGMLADALAAAAALGVPLTDEAGAMEACGHAPLLVEGALENFKLTWPADFDLAERLFATRP